MKYVNIHVDIFMLVVKSGAKPDFNLTKSFPIGTE